MTVYQYGRVEKDLRAESSNYTYILAVAKKIKINPGKDCQCFNLRSMKRFMYLYKANEELHVYLCFRDVP